MFWRFGGGLPSSAIDGLLDKEDLTLEELLDEDDLLQECKAHNNKLIEYLREPAIISQLLNYITREDLDDRQKFKYPCTACEVLSCEIWAICEAVIDNLDLLTSFWQLLDRPPPLNPLQASYFVKVNVVFLQKKTSEMVKFIQSIPDIVNKLLIHMETSAIMDLLLKLISVEESSEGAGVVDWLNSKCLIQALISKLEPGLSPDMHSTAAQVLIDIIAISQPSNPEQGSVGPNALSRELISERTVSRLVDYMLDSRAPNSTSTLTNGVNIFIQIIQKNYNEESLLHQQHPVVDLSDMLRVLANRIVEFKMLLENPKSVSGEIDTTIGKMVPLGFERFRICELFAELLHCSNMSLLNDIRPTNGVSELKQVGEYNEYDHTEAAFVPPIKVLSQNTQNGVQSDTHSDSEVSASITKNNQEQISEETQTSLTATSPMEAIEPGSEFSANANNADLSTQLEESSAPQLPVGDLLKAKFIEYKIIPTCLDLFFNFKWNNFLHAVVFDMIAQIFHGNMDIGYNKALAISVFTDGHLTKRITKAQEENDEAVKQSKGVRLGYMGHLTLIAERVDKLLKKYTEISKSVKEYIEPDWHEYVSKTLRETKERDEAPLGGQRPNSTDSLTTNRGESDDDDDEAKCTDYQYTNYMYQQMNPDKYNSSDEDDDDDDATWMGDARDADYEMRGSFVNPNNVFGGLFENRQSLLDDGFGENRQSSLDDGFGEIDEEGNSDQWSADLQLRNNIPQGPQVPISNDKTITNTATMSESPASTKSPPSSTQTTDAGERRSPNILNDDEEDEDNEEKRLPIGHESPTMKNRLATTNQSGTEEKNIDFTFDKMDIRVEGGGGGSEGGGNNEYKEKI